MGNVRFLHTADWQLGMTRHYLAPEAQARFTAARLEAVRAIGGLAAQLDCAFVVVCGDVFESNHIDRQVLLRALDAMRAVPVPLYLLPGNHDPLDAGSLLGSAAFRDHAPPGVHVLDSFEPREVAPGVLLHPAPWPTKHPLEDLAARALLAADGRAAAHVLAAHGIVDALSPDAADPKLIVLARLEEAVAAGRLAYAALGDRHSVTDVGSTGRVWYSGAPEATDYDELDAGCVLAVELPAAGGAPRVERHRVGRWRFVREVRALDGADDVRRLDELLAARDDKERTVLKLGFEGTLALRDKARLDAVLDHHRDLYAGLELWRRRTDLAVVPEDADFSDLGLTGFAADAMRELRAAALQPGEEGEAAADALALLVRLTAGAPS